MRNYRRQAVRVLLVVVFGLFALPGLIGGLHLLRLWVRTHRTNFYYVEYPYLSTAFIFIFVAAVGLASCAFAAWRRKFFGLTFTIALVMNLVVFAAIIPSGSWQSIKADHDYLSETQAVLDRWYEKHRTFPLSETEYREALKTGPEEWEPPALSIYSQKGNRLPYEIVVISNATGPRSNNLSSRPGVVYYCVSTDQQHYWITMTSLEGDLAPAATSKREASLGDGSIEGVAIDQEGQPAKGIDLAAADPLGKVVHTRADDRGVFSFYDLTWGKYTIYGEDDQAGYSTFSNGPSRDRPSEIAPDHRYADVAVHLPPKAGFLRINLTNHRTGASIAGMKVAIMSAEKPSSLLFSTSCSTSRVILVPPDKNLLLHVTSDGFREWDESAEKGRPLQLASGASLTLNVQLDPSH